MKTKYDWKKVQEYYDTGVSIKECMRKFGFAVHSWDRALKRGDVKSRTLVKPVEYYLYNGGTYRNDIVKRKLISSGLVENKCSVCGCLPFWNGKILVLILDHKNGKKRDYRLENLRLVCPNCNSQLDTFGSRNIIKQRLLPCGVIGSTSVSGTGDEGSNPSVATKIYGQSKHTRPSPQSPQGRGYKRRTGDKQYKAKRDF